MAQQGHGAQRFSSFMKKGMKAHQAGQYFQALRHYEAALSVAPRHPGALVNIGLCHFEQNRPRKALVYFQAANANHPGEPFIQANLGTCLLKLGRAAEALPWLSAALKRNPRDIAAAFLVGRALHQLGRWNEAVSLYAQYMDRALVSKPDLALDMAIILTKMKKHGEAAEVSMQLRARHPDLLLPNLLAYANLQESAQWEALEDLDRDVTAQFAKRAKSADRDPGEFWTPFAAVNRFSDEAIHRTVAEAALERELGSIDDAMSFPSYERSGGKMRVGYLSSDFNDHPVMHLLEGVLKHHASDKLEVFCYSVGKKRDSYYTAVAEKYATAFRDLQGQSLREIAEAIHQDELDLIIDLNGHTEQSKLAALSYRPARIQASFIGFPGTTGAQFIDYLIADPIVAPRESTAHFSEILAWHPYSYLPVTRPALDAATPTSRAAWGLPDDAVVFCSFNALRKIEPVRFASWMACLRQIEGSVLWLASKNEAVDETLRQQAERAGVDRGRLNFAPRVETRLEHLERMRHADIALDTRVYNGHATTIDALLGGLPVVATRGAHFASRVSASILNAISQPELVGADESDFVSIATGLASDRSRVREMKDRVAARVETAPAFDVEKYTRALERLFEAMIAAGPARRRRDRSPIEIEAPN